MISTASIRNTVAVILVILAVVVTTLYCLDIFTLVQFKDTLPVEYKNSIDFSLYRGITDLTEAQAALHRFIVKKQYYCHYQPRYGNKGDGGYEICQDAPYALHTNTCLIYSLGSRNEFSFEDAVYKALHCEIHIFDPSVNSSEYQRKPRMYFHPIGLAGSDGDVIVDGTKWAMKTVSSVMKLLKHDRVDVIKMDIEGYEWPVVKNMMESGVINNVGQLLVEFHTNKYKDDVMQLSDYMDMQRVLTNLSQHSYQQFMYHTNNGCCGRFAVMTSRSANRMKTLCCYEILYVNTKYR